MKKNTSKSAPKAKKPRIKKDSLVKVITKKIEKKEKSSIVGVKEKLSINYLYAIGRRKSSTARIRYYKKGNSNLTINNKEYIKYFPYFEYQKIIQEPFQVIPDKPRGDFTIRVTGGGVRGQAESIRLGISRILLKINSEIRPLLKAKKLLHRDPRVKERK